MVPGPCEGSYFHYGYNSERGICEQFKYGGCLGKPMNAYQLMYDKLLQEITTSSRQLRSAMMCVLKMTSSWCSLTSVSSPSSRDPGKKDIFCLWEGISFHSCLSAGNFTRYGYDKETETCEEFNYGGCKGDIDAFICVWLLSFSFIILIIQETSTASCQCLSVKIVVRTAAAQGRCVFYQGESIIRRETSNCLQGPGTLPG